MSKLDWQSGVQMKGWACMLNNLRGVQCLSSAYELPVVTVRLRKCLTSLILVEGFSFLSTSILSVSGRIDTSLTNDLNNYFFP